jgi:membrane dipeptidase
MDSLVNARPTVVNTIGASWYEDLTDTLLDECLSLGVDIIGCTANETWDDTLESMANLQSVKELIRRHGKAYVVQSKSDLENSQNSDKVGVILGFQNPKAMSDSIHFLEAFIDMGLRCCSLAFRDNSYYGCGFSSPVDSGLSEIGQRAVKTMNRRGVVIDLSHAGDKTAFDAVELSEHPVIFSHSTSRALIKQRPNPAWAGVRNSAERRCAPDELIKAAAAKGGVICPDSRMAGSLSTFTDHIDYLIHLVGVDHVGVSAQDDWHRSEKDARRIQPYLPGYDSMIGKKKREFGADYRIYRMEDQLGPQVIHKDVLFAALRAKNYSEEDIRKISGGNMLRVLQQTLPG